MKVTGDTELNAYSIAATTPLSFGLHSITRETRRRKSAKREFWWWTMIRDCCAC